MWANVPWMVTPAESMTMEPPLADNVILVPVIMISPGLSLLPIVTKGAAMLTSDVPMTLVAGLPGA